MSRDWTEQIYGDMESISIDDIIKEKEKQIERLQEQLNEANEVIKKYMSVAFGIRSEGEKPTVLQLAFNYLKKWGVK